MTNALDSNEQRKPVSVDRRRDQLRRVASAIAIGWATQCRADVPRSDYVERLRRSGYADWALDFLNLELSRTSLDAQSRAELEFEIAASLISASEMAGDLSRRGQMLDDAGRKLEDFVRNHPNHPLSGASRSELGHADLQRAQLLTLQAQTSGNSPQSRTFVEQSRKRFEAAVGNYKAAFEQMQAAYKAMPVFIPEDQLEKRAAKSKLFERFIEARFQAALAGFYLADSFRSTENGPKSEKANAATAEDRRNFGEKLETARAEFEAIYNEHRRELVGLYAHLWMARCLAAKGEHRRAMGIFEQLAKYDNRELAAFQREVFHFRIISLAARKEFDQVIGQGTTWLRDRARFATDPAYLGVQWQVAQALLSRAQTGDDASNRRDVADAGRLLERLTAFPNSFSPLARKAQLAIAGESVRESGGREPAVRGLQQATSLAAAKLDALSGQTDSLTRQESISKIVQSLRMAIAGARAADDLTSLNDARLTLAYANLQIEYFDEAAVLAESIARFYPKSSAAPAAAALAVNAYALEYEKGREDASKGLRTYSEIDATKIRSLAELLSQKWGGSKEAAQGLVVAGRLELSLNNFAAAIADFDRAAKSARDPVAGFLAARSRWEWFKVASATGKLDKSTLLQLRTQAIAGFEDASKAMRATRTAFDRDRFLNDLLLAESQVDAGNADAAAIAIEPLVQAIDGGKLSGDIEPALRIAAISLAIQSAVRKGDPAACDRLVELIGKQRGADASSNVTQVFLSLANRMREQLDRLKATGDAGKAESLTRSFETFLDRLSQRATGQTMQSRIDLATNYLELGRPAKAIAWVEKTLADPSAAESANAGLHFRGKLLLARAFADSGDFAKARSAIDQLYLENRGSKEILRRRGEILERQGDFKAAVSHWKDAINRMQRQRPRPEEFYEAVEHAILLADHFEGDDKAKLLKQGRYLAKFLLETDTGLPAKWKSVYAEQLRKIDGQLADK